MTDKERYNAIKILDYIDMYCNLDSMGCEDREDIIRYIVSVFKGE